MPVFHIPTDDDGSADLAVVKARFANTDATEAPCTGCRDGRLRLYKSIGSVTAGRLVSRDHFTCEACGCEVTVTDRPPQRTLREFAEGST